MELVEQGKLEKKNNLLKKLEKYLSFDKYCAKTKTKAMFTKSKSRHKSTAEALRNNCKPIKKCRVVPSGCFSVYVGSEKQKFVIKTEYVNHPLFKMLLEDAETEYGFENEGPLLLPCGVDLFWKVLAQILDSGEEFEHHLNGFACCSCSPFNSVRRLDKIGSSYGLLSSYPIGVSRT